MAKHDTFAWSQPTRLMKKHNEICYAHLTPIFPVNAVVSNCADAQLITLITYLQNWWPTLSADELMPEYWLIMAHIGFSDIELSAISGLELRDCDTVCWELGCQSIWMRRKMRQGLVTNVNERILILSWEFSKNGNFFLKKTMTVLMWKKLQMITLNLRITF